MQIAYVTNTANLAKSKSRRAKLFAESAGIELSKGSKAVHEWRTPQGGGLVAAGVGGLPSGYGFDLMIVDDPYKGRAEAESEVIREKVWDWFINVAYPRLEPGASVIVCMARWNEDDLVGRLLSLESAAPWSLLTLPAVVERGLERKPLWPEKFSIEHLDRIKQQVGPYVWESLYQGNPSAKEGNVFKRVWFEGADATYVDLAALGPLRHRVLSVDGAWKTGVGNDYSALHTWDFRGKNTLALVARVKLRLELPDLIAAIVHEYNTYRPNVVAIEATASGIGALQILRRDTIIPVVAVNVAGASKEQRADNVAPLMESGVCRFPKGAAWMRDYTNEMCSFPNGAHDDDVDATGIALNRIKQYAAGNVVDIFGWAAGGAVVPSVYAR
jgi:predicted phage terminase large subunit-like protein